MTLLPCVVRRRRLNRPSRYRLILFQERATRRIPGSTSGISIPLVCGLLVLGVLLVPPSPASAQAWVAPARVGAVNIVFQNVDHTGHLLDDGSRLDGFDSESRGLLVEVDYAVTSRFSFNVGVPYIGAKYTGPEPSFFGLPIDDCNCWNTGFQDLSLTARYNVFNDAFALTPSVSYGYPTNDYPFFGEAAIGRNLDEFRVALDAGYRIDAISPRFSVSGRYSYAFVEEVLDIPNNRSNAYLSFDYLATRRFSTSLQLYWQRSHGGLRSTEFETEEEWIQFDRLLKDNSFHVGATFAYSFSRMNVFASYTEFVSGTDTHVGHAITIGVSTPFQI